MRGWEDGNSIAHYGSVEIVCMNAYTVCVSRNKSNLNPQKKRCKYFIWWVSRLLAIDFRGKCVTKIKSIHPTKWSLVHWAARPPALQQTVQISTRKRSSLPCPDKPNILCNLSHSKVHSVQGETGVLSEYSQRCHDDRLPPTA